MDTGRQVGNMSSVMVHLLMKMSKLDATLQSVYMNNINAMGLRHIRQFKRSGRQVDVLPTI